MRIKWLGHACFLITGDNGLRIITDPYTSGGGIRYDDIKESADIVTISHEHNDHNNAQAIGGNPAVLKKGQKVKGIDIRSISSFHDTEDGQQRGRNTIFCFEIDQVTICHLGDLGHPLDDEQITQLNKVDVLLIPVGGYYTIDAQVASQIIDQIKPQITIPMHFKTSKLDYPIAHVDIFLNNKTGVRRLKTSEIELNKESLPSDAQIIILEPDL